MPAGTTNTCSGNFYDSGGSAGSYGNNESKTTTFCSNAGNCVRVIFSSIALSNNDVLKIYDGPNTTSTLLGTYTNTTTSPGTITSSNGCLTFEFTSNNSGINNGWAAAISCVACPVLNYNMPTGTTNTCSGNFYDNGGSGGSYTNSQNNTTTFCSNAGNCTQVTFSSFNTENNYDILSIYDGPNTSSTLIGSYSGSNSPGTITSTSGCLTFRFVSDGSVTYTGWEASLSCVICPPPPVPPANDECTGAVTLVSNTTCSNTSGTITLATASSQANTCGGTANNDVWFKFVATATTQNITISNVAGSTTDLYHSVYGGTCASIGAPLVCSDPNSSTVTGLTIGNTYYVRVFSWGSVTANATFDICITGCSSGAANDDCAGAITLTMNTFGSCASTSSGNVSCASPSGTSSGACFGTPNDDIWFKFVATASAHTLTLTTSSGFDAYMQLYSGTCASLTSIQCSDPNTFNASGLVIGQTYFVRVYSYYSSAITNGSLTLCVAEPPSCPANLGSGNITIASLPYNGTGQTTCGAGNEITASNAITCGSDYYLGDADKVYIFTPSSSGQVTVTLNSTQSWTSATLYEGCPFSGSCVAFVQTSSSGSKNFCTSVVSGTTYYLVIDGWGTSGACISSYTLNITAPSSGVANDLPCNATSLALGAASSGTNFCTSGAGEPAAASCWTSGNLNTVWYSFVSPASGTVYIEATPSTITSNQIALYSGTCSSLTLVFCNQYPGTGCSGTTGTNSIINATGLTPGATYYIRVDGRNDNTGTFSILVDNGSSSGTSPVPGQDCLSPQVVCSSVMTIGNPGYANTGNICDFTGTGNCTGGEKNSVWYQVNISSTGNFNFTIKPNDAANASCGAETDYDFLLWKISGSGTTTNCNTISSSSGTALLACNYNSYGVTGVAPGGNAPAPYNTCFDGAFEPTVSVTAGDVLYLVIQNFSSSTQGFTLDMTSSGSGVVNYTAPPTVYWTGGANTTWTNATNWGGCATYPICGINAVITAASTTQPIITGTENVKDITINQGSTLTLGANAILNVCGNFTNNGTLICDPTSTIRFNNGSVIHNISGSLTGGNKLGHLVIDKTGGSVILNNSIDIGGNFTTSNATSIFNSNEEYVKIAGNFINNRGNTTYVNTGSSGILEFNGSQAQTYNQGSLQLDLNNVIMNHTSTGLTLLTNMHVKANSGTLVLTLGKIITNAFEVNVANTTPTSVSTGNSSSYVEGNLRRSLLSVGSYDFPVGFSTKGYQRANVNFTASTSIGNLLARFDPWATTPPTQGGTECATTYDQPSENNGYWTITANANAATGIYNLTLYQTSATNTTGMAAWTVIKNPSIASGTWSLNGTCDPSSTAAIVKRNSMSGFSVFGIAQALTPLPIQLLSFTGKNQGKANILEWITASEINNDYFTIEKSDDSNNFEEMAIIDGSGNSRDLIKYDQYDHNPYNGTTYYRLKQTDFDGKFEYSDIVAVESTKDDEIFTVFPNPVANTANVSFHGYQTDEVVLNIMDATGRLVLTKKAISQKGMNTVKIDTSNLTRGIYFVTLITNNEVLKTKFMKE
ncbi:MAG TPA: CUB domain-containing protein [Bacteroidia bacterium]|nr:CUB domain-containing protein [Bacteroidia bacterium]